MAIYHFNVVGVSAGRGQSVIARAAYDSGEKLMRLDGTMADYSRKEHVRENGLLLPASAGKWTRQELWLNAERNRIGTERQAQRLEFSLPVELNSTEQKQLLMDFVAPFVESGRAVDWAIHDNPGNPHAHVLVSSQVITSAGFEKKEKTDTKAYLVRDKFGQEKTIIAADWKSAKADGWEKVFRYAAGNGEAVRLTKTEAKELGLKNSDRLSTSPVQTHISAETGQKSYESDKQELKCERKRWEVCVNSALKEKEKKTGEVIKPIDCRSHAERGLPLEPTIHEGRWSRLGEAPAERAAYNATVRERNSLVVELLKLVVDELNKNWWLTIGSSRNKAAWERRHKIMRSSGRGKEHVSTIELVGELVVDVGGDVLSAIVSGITNFFKGNSAKPDTSLTQPDTNLTPQVETPKEPTIEPKPEPVKPEPVELEPVEEQQPLVNMLDGDFFNPDQIGNLFSQQAQPKPDNPNELKAKLKAAKEAQERARSDQSRKGPKH